MNKNNVLIFATNNAHKLEEVRKILGDKFEILSLSDIGCHEEIPEDGNQLFDNALQKAMYVSKKYKVSCFADDTGLMVDALNGEPGVYSARYAGEGHDSEANMTKLLKNMEGVDNRKAYFETVIVLVNYEGESDDCGGHGTFRSISHFEGRVDGVITRQRSGAEGFGYDPIFQPDGYDKTFAELGNDVKNKISHRARATQKFAEYLMKQKPCTQ